MIQSPFGKTEVVSVAKNNPIKTIKFNEIKKEEIKHDTNISAEDERAQILMGYGSQESNIPSDHRYWRIGR